MLKDIDNIKGCYKRQLVSHFEEYSLFFNDFEIIKELIDFWGVLYMGEKRFDKRQILDFSKRRKISSFAKSERLLVKQSRLENRSDVFWQLENRKVKDMDKNVRVVAEILYRAKLCEVAV